MNEVVTNIDGAYVEQIRESLLAIGSAWSSLDQDAARWRRIARRVARELGRPIRTLALPDGTAAASLSDWPANPDEERIHLDRQRAMMQGVADANGPSRHLFPVR